MNDVIRERIARLLVRARLTGHETECGGCAFLMDSEGNRIPDTVFMGKGVADNEPMQFCNDCRRMVSSLLKKDNK